MSSYTVKYSKTGSGYMGQLIEWPEVISEAESIEECQLMIRDALNEMVLAYRHLNKEIPTGSFIYEQITTDVENVS